MTPRVYLNGRLVPAGRAAISIDDHGFLYGDGAYETLRAYGGKPSFLMDHLRRLESSLSGLRLSRPPSQIMLRQAVVKVIDSNRLSDAVVRITVTRGPGPRGLDPRLCPEPTVLITAAPVPILPPAVYSAGVTVALATVRRNDPAATPPAIKSISCLNGVLAKMQANDLKAFEALMLSADGALTEGTVTNFFLVKGRTLSTPRLDGSLLAGVTRGAVIRLARRAGYRIQERRLAPRDLRAADEMFLTSTVMEIVPVSRVIFQSPRRNTVRVGDGRPGFVTRDLMARYRAAVRPR